MPTTLKTAAESYLRGKALSRGTRNEYLSTLRKWERWGGGIPIEQLRRKDIREFLDWVYEHVPESSVEILGHSVGGITYRHYAHRAPLAFRAIMTLPQPSAFSAILRGGDSECPCCRRRFADAG